MEEIREITELTPAETKRVLVVGAGGFLGGYLVWEALHRGYEVWAGVRQSTRRDRFTDPRIKFINFDFDDPAAVLESINQTMGEFRWDYIIYNLGATKVGRYSDFSRINYEYLKVFTGALHHTDKVPDKLLYISSLSVLGPQDERGYSPYHEEMIPHPNTRYGSSKLKAELWLATAGIPYIIFRATGIYGPWDHDYFLMFDSIRKGVDFGVGYRKQMLTFIYAQDLAEAACEALEHSPVDEIYHISEPRAYTQKEFRRIAMREMGKKFVLPLRLPLWIAKVACAICDKIGWLRSRPSTLNNDKDRILRQRNWNCSVDKAERGFGFRAKTSLEEGVRQTIAWYREAGWLKDKKDKKGKRSSAESAD